jgi:ribosomal protein L24
VTKPLDVGDRVRITSGDHKGRLGKVIETDLGDLALRIEAEDGQVVVTEWESGRITATGHGGRGGFVAALEDFDLEPAGGS